MSDDQDFIKHHQPLTCKFCGRGAGYAPLAEMSKFGVDIYFCHPCSAEYVIWAKGNGDYASCSLYTEVNGKMYRLTFQPENIAVLWHVKNPGIPGTRVNKNLDKVMSFTYHPEVTPFNFNEKIKTWLVFI